MAYYRPPEQMPPVVKNLLIANGLVFFAQYIFANQGTDLGDYGGLWPLRSDYFRVWQLVTHMFMHDVGNLYHIIFNMLALWMFGRMLENYWGPKRFFQFYMICGLFAGITHLVLEPGGGYAIGASGAVMGVLAGYAYLFPNSSLFIMLIPIPVKAKYAIPGLMALDIFGVINQSNDNVAHWAHLGGAAAGLALVYFWNKKNRSNFY